MVLKQAFFLDILKKTQAEKTQVWEKLKPNFWEKLNEPEDFWNILEENSTYRRTFPLLV